MTPDRFDLLEQDVRAHAKTITELVQSEARRIDKEKVQEEVEELKEKHLNERLDRIEASIKSVYTLGKWLLAAAGATLLTAFISFILRGGPLGG